MFITQVAGFWGRDVVGLMADAAARQHPECPFSAERGLSRTSRERRERGLYLGRLQVEVPYHGVARSPLRGRVSPPAGVRVSPNGGFDFPQRGV